MLIALKEFAVVILLYIPLGSNAFGQDSLVHHTQHYISVQSGYSRHMVKDDVISPLVYSGSQIPILLNWQMSARKGQHSITGYYDYVKLTSSITITSPAEAFYAENHNAFIKYSYNRKIVTFTQWETSVFAGPELKFLLNQRDHYYNNYTHYNTGEFISSLELSFLVLKEFSKSQDKFSFRYNMSVIAYDMLNYLYNANVPKKLNIDASQNTSANLIKGNSLVTLNKYFEFQTELSYVKFINKFMGVEIKYCFQYYNLEKYHNLLYTRYINSQYLLGFMVKIY